MLDKTIKIKFKAFTSIYKMNIYYYWGWKSVKKDKSFFKASNNDFKEKVKATNDNCFVFIKISSLDKIFSRNQGNWHNYKPS